MLLHSLELVMIVILGLLYVCYDVPEISEIENDEKPKKAETKNKVHVIQKLSLFFAKMRGEICKRIASDSCCICYGDIKEEVQGSCGHIFCGSCLVEFWHSKGNKKMSCPLCRAEMNLLISKNQKDSKIKKQTDEYNKLFSNNPENVEELCGIMQRRIENFIISVLQNKQLNSFVTGALPVFLGLVLLVYIVSPSSLLPEYTPILNFIENLFLITFSIIYATLTYNKSKKLQEEDEDETPQFIM